MGKKMDPGFNKNITVVCDGTWMTHIGVDTVIESYSSVVTDYCHGCMPRPEEGENEYCG